MPNDEERLRKLPARLLKWYDKAKRDLPWRRTRNPYRIWLAEVMLQQTRVETVVPYYKRFLKRFPKLTDLAQAPVDDVLEVWAGLGYYSRARNFHAAAQKTVENHGGKVPRRLEDMLQLPGVGRYTAGAVLSIAYRQPVPILDGNVTRILCRLFAIKSNPKLGRTQKRLWALSESLLPRDRPGDFNQAMMEFGATLCTPKTPACSACPVANLCEALRLGKVEQLPKMPKPKPVPHYDVAVGLIWRRKRLLIAKRPMDVMLGGLWEFPGGKPEKGETLEEALHREVKEEVGLTVEVGPLLTTVNHAYSHFKVTLHAFHCRSGRGRPRALACDAVRWVAVGQLRDYPFPAGSLRIIRRLLEGPDPFGPKRSHGRWSWGGLNVPPA
ncbi:MAG: A/G-specific adenine glycosylase [Planctomycetes bacterium]|nr:A/G-specific adenine glycosylase [Planctomycetota bacterium]